MFDELRLRVFPAFSYTCILDGYDRLPRRPYPLLDHLGFEMGERALAQLAVRSAEIASAMPQHYDYLRSMSPSVEHVQGST